MTNNQPQPNVSISISGGKFNDFVAGNKEIRVEGNYINTQINSKETPDSTELAQELDDLLQNLEQTVPNSVSESGKEIVKNNALQEIENKPLLKKKLLAAIKAGTIKAVEEFCKHPLASVLLAAFKAAFPDDKKA